VTGIGYFRGPEARTRYFARYAEAIGWCPVAREPIDVDTAYGQVRVYRHGPAEGAPIVLLHGRGTTSAVWEPNLAALAAEHPVFAVDTLGEPGHSMQCVPIRSRVDCAAWLDEVLAKLDLTGVHLVGSSAGGWLAFNQAVHRPARLASVALLDPANVLGRFTPKFTIGSVGALPAMPAGVNERFLRWVAGGSATHTPVARLLIAGMREYRARLPRLSYCGDELLEAVRTPVLALLGGRSVVHDSVAAESRARRLLPGIETEIWPDASHAIAVEAADAVNKRLLAFVDDRT
jgi:pimeloyl-ACP methyl ester carboxylesterase